MVELLLLWSTSSEKVDTWRYLRHKPIEKWRLLLYSNLFCCIWQPETQYNHEHLASEKIHIHLNGDTSYPQISACNWTLFWLCWNTVWHTQLISYMLTNIHRIYHIDTCTCMFFLETSCTIVCDVVWATAIYGHRCLNVLVIWTDIVVSFGSMTRQEHIKSNPDLNLKLRFLKQ